MYSQLGDRRGRCFRSMERWSNTGRIQPTLAQVGRHWQTLDRGQISSRGKLVQQSLCSVGSSQVSRFGNTTLGSVLQIRDTFDQLRPTWHGIDQLGPDFGLELTSTTFGQTRHRIHQSLARSRQTSTRLDSISAAFGAKSNNVGPIGKFRKHLARNRTALAKFRSKFAQRGKFGLSYYIIGQHWHKLGQIWPGVDQVLPSIDQLRPNLLWN